MFGDVVEKFIGDPGEVPGITSRSERHRREWGPLYNRPDFRGGVGRLGAVWHPRSLYRNGQKRETTAP